MTEYDYTLRLSGEGKNPSEALELKVRGVVLKEGDKFIMHKEYPHCDIGYEVTGVSHELDMPKIPFRVYKLETIVSAVRVSSKQYLFKKK